MAQQILGLANAKLFNRRKQKQKFLEADYGGKIKTKKLLALYPKMAIVKTVLHCRCKNCIESSLSH
jgi:hypothetical protein